MNVNSGFSNLSNAYLRPRVVYTKGPCPLSGPSVASPSSISDMTNMMMGIGLQDNQQLEKYSRKVFIGGLPPDIFESELS